jgi:hypothetical protein
VFRGENIEKVATPGSYDGFSGGSNCSGFSGSSTYNLDLPASYYISLLQGGKSLVRFKAASLPVRSSCAGRRTANFAAKILDHTGATVGTAWAG